MLTGYHRGSLAEGIRPSQERGLWGTSAQSVLTLREDSGLSLAWWWLGKEVPGGNSKRGSSLSLSACVRSLFILILLSHVETMWEPCGKAPLPFHRSLASFLGRGHSHNLLSLSSHAPLSFPTISSACSWVRILGLDVTEGVIPQGFP